MPLTVVVLSERLPGVLPAAALPALRTAPHVVADPAVPADVVSAAGAVRGTDAPTDGVLVTTDAAHPAVAAADVVVRTPEPAGAVLLDAVAVMNRLRSPGGCPWDAEQSHESLLQYLVEECYELYEAVEDGDRAAIREELGDVLLQVLFHARIATESPNADRFGIDEVAADLVAKLVGRHPHVFAGSERVTTAYQERSWEELKRAEKQRESSVDGVPLGQPAVALAAKLASRTARAGLPAELLPAELLPAELLPAELLPAELPGGVGVGELLFALAARAKLAGVDPEAELRTAARRFAGSVRAAERAAAEDGLDPHALTAEEWKRYWPG